LERDHHPALPLNTQGAAGLQPATPEFRMRAPDEVLMLEPDLNGQSSDLAPAKPSLPPSSDTHGWEALLTGSDRERAGDALEAILRAFDDVDPDLLGPSLDGGAAGVALLFGYATLSGSGSARSQFHQRTHAWLDQAVAQSERMAGNLSLYLGYTGLGWAADHLIHQRLLAVDEDPNIDLDQALLDHLHPRTWKGRAELVEGLAGLGLYAIDRRGRGRSPMILARVLQILDDRAERGPEGLAWFDGPEVLYPQALEAMPDGLFNLGLSHGNPGVLGFLAEAAPLSPKAGRLLEEAAAWLVAQKDPHPDGSFYGFGFARGQRSRNPDGSRLSWCYGDLGISLVMLLAARRHHRVDWEREALALGRACATRPDPFRGVDEAGLCHGALGNGHLFNRLYQATGAPEARVAALAMYHAGLERWETGVKVSGSVARAAGTGDARADLELLRGAAGVGLALLAGTTTIEPQWDRHLLTHVSPDGR
jgi:hypothetical protein